MNTQLSPWVRVRGHVYEAIDGRDVRSPFEKTFIVFICSLIVLSVGSAILETLPALSNRYQRLFDGFEIFFLTVFVLEYVVRLITCTADSRFAHPVTGRLRFIVTPLALLDLAAIAPSLLLFGRVDLVFLRLFRLARFLRVLKLGRYSVSLKTLGNVIRSRRGELGVAAFGAAVLLVVASSLMYVAEHDDQPKAFPSIPAAMWWGVMTLTTVGYGDVYPITSLGKLLASVIALLSIGLFALPAGILASGFSEEMRKRREGKRRCPHCGGQID
jgi:voltage-gated potassium channel